MGRTATRQPAAPASDPLADLRPPEDTTPAGHTPETEAEVAEVRPTATQAQHDAMRAEVVAAYHADTVATGMLHKGGTCGCRYLAGLALQTALGAPQEREDDDAQEQEGDES